MCNRKIRNRVIRDNFPSCFFAQKWIMFQRKRSPKNEEYGGHLYSAEDRALNL